MDRSISQEKQIIKRPKLGKSDFNPGIRMGDNGGDSDTKGMDMNDSADSSSDYEIDNEKIYALQHNLEYVNVELQEIYKEMVRMRDQNNQRELQKKIRPLGSSHCQKRQGCDNVEKPNPRSREEGNEL
jgi:hypothetical protein